MGGRRAPRHARGDVRGAFTVHAGAAGQLTVRRAHRARPLPSLQSARRLWCPPRRPVVVGWQVANRGGALIKKWGRSSAASTAVSVADHLRSL